MTQIYIDGRLAVLDHSTKIKSVFDNVYFTKSSKYTLEVTFPMEGCAVNQKIFKHINRNDVFKSPQTLKAILISNNKVIINGTAVITSISNKNVKAQLLSGNSELNFFVSDDKYIDELNLGYNYSPPSDFHPGQETDIYYNSYPFVSSIWMPVYNESAGEIYNKIAASHSIIGGEEVESLKHYEAVYYKWCVQPYLCAVIKRIVLAIGYELIENQIDATIFKNLYICNATVTDYFADVLPHWTVNEFFNQLEKFLGVITVADEGNKTVRIVFAHNFFDTSNPIYLDNVIEDYEADVDEEETTDLSNANIGYDLSGSDTWIYKKPDENILKKYKIKEYETQEQLNAAYESIDDYNKVRTIFEAEGQQYIHYVEGDKSWLKEINQFRDLIRNSEKSDLDIELKIVPVGMTMMETEVYAPGTVFDGNIRWKAKFALPSLEGEIFNNFESLTVQEAIEGETTEKFTPNLIQVAFNDGSMKKLHGPDGKTHVYPMPFIDGNNDMPDYQYAPNWSLRLNKNRDFQSIGSNILERVKKINTLVPETKKFVSDKLFDPMSVFVINNKKYVSKQINLSIDDEKIDPMQEGIFYELTD